MASLDDRDTSFARESSRRPPGPGLPALINPYKLLAEAATEDEDSHTQRRSGRRGPPSSSLSHAVDPSDQLRWSTFFSAGVYQPRPDSDTSLDPVAVGLLSAWRAEWLFQRYMDALNDVNTLLDVSLHTFDHVRRHALLLCAVCLVVARMESFEGAAELCDALEVHIQGKVLPAVAFGGRRSTEVVLGLVLLTAYLTSSLYVYDDRSWALMGMAIRVATELDLNARVVSRAVPDNDDVVLKRTLRAQERAWLDLWLLEQSIALQTGRRPSLSVEGVVEEALEGKWHLSPLAVRGDAAILAHASLRQLYAQSRSLFNRLCQLSHESEGASGQALGKHDLAYFLRRVEEDLRTWSATWRDVEPASARAGRLRLYAHHAEVMLFSMPLQFLPPADSPLDVKALEPAIVRLYESTLAYMLELGTEPLQRGLRVSHNSVFISGTYVAAMAVKLAALRPQLGWIDAQRLLDLARATAESFSEAGRRPAHRQAPAAQYGAYLSWLLRKYTAPASRARGADAAPRQPGSQGPVGGLTVTTMTETQLGGGSGTAEAPRRALRDEVKLPTAVEGGQDAPDAAIESLVTRPTTVTDAEVEAAASLEGMSMLGDGCAFSSDADFVTWMQTVLAGGEP